MKQLIYGIVKHPKKNSPRAYRPVNYETSYKHVQNKLSTLTKTIHEQIMHSVMQLLTYSSVKPNTINLHKYWLGKEIFEQIEPKARNHKAIP